MPTPLLLVCALSLETYFYGHAEGLVPPNIGFSNGIEVAVSENESCNAAGGKAIFPLQLFGSSFMELIFSLLIKLSNCRIKGSLLFLEHKIF